MAAERFAMRTAAAPSLIWLEFPAVVVPPGFLNAGLSLAKRYGVVSALHPSSLSTSTSLSFPSLSATIAIYGVISYYAQPIFYAYAAF